MLLKTGSKVSSERGVGMGWDLNGVGHNSIHMLILVKPALEKERKVPHFPSFRVSQLVGLGPTMYDRYLMLLKSWDWDLVFLQSWDCDF